MMSTYEMDQLQTGSEIRDKSRKAIYYALQGACPNIPEASNISAEIETNVFHQHNDETHNDYRHDVRSRILNLKKNTLLSKSLLNGSLAPSTFAKMTSEEMATPERKRENKEILDEALHQTMFVDTIEPHKNEMDIVPGEAQGIMPRSGYPGIEFEAPGAGDT
ncbi:Transcription elongation factor A protein 2 [Neolecta irregularis DAH-3]|uniref:Transcription elongation factor A protein 2 n=1 Tax=Neolecta irregularis (strain DAH-3) TaxID=1198029 RepID=A0A1U7LVB3_NEOID|nr:Transcription elongation factor A protein 2 [Neolecta irregularis DAH-3]|eukprot:OLL26615.1 Transcription elongation factor A protein 2 [Neolecta irregularis DAH-3]